MAYYYLEVIRGAEQGRLYLIPDGAASIGRSSSNTLVLHSAERAVSSHHAIIYKSESKLLIQDMQSTNGTFINEQRITEQEILENDTIGFGKMGPRLKLIVSDTELKTGPVPTSKPEQSTNERTSENTSQPHFKPPTESEFDATKTAMGIHSKAQPQKTPNNPVDAMPQGSSYTMELENKLLNDQMGAEDMHSLMKDGERLERILDRGNINKGQSALLVSAYQAGKKSRKKWIVLVASLVSLFIVVTLFLSIRMLQYKHVLDKGVSLESKLNAYENKIFSENLRPDANKKELAELIKKLEETKKELQAVKSNIKTEDFGKLYTDTTERKIDAIMQRFGETDYHIPPTMIQRVKYHISVYSGNLKPVIARYLKRKEIYFPMITRIFRQKNLPVELAYISMLESGFNPKALSHAGARGLWQFMPQTARTYGLRVDDKMDIDDRCDPEKATYAAAQYFKGLIGIFGGKSSIMFAMAAYNAGEGRVMGALRKIDDPMRNRDFWYIYRMGYLAEETNEYIPRVLALMIIDQNPAKYGFGAAVLLDTSEKNIEKDFIEIDLND